jgi:hypothetical protein
MNQNDVRRLSSFIYECFLLRALGVDPALNLLSESGTLVGLFQVASCRVNLQAVACFRCG